MLPLLSHAYLAGGEFDDQNLGAAAEDLVRNAIANCAPRLLIPQLPSEVRKRGFRYDLRTISPTARARVSIIDRRLTTWHSVRDYFAPIQAAVPIGAQDAGHFDVIARAVYYLVLGSRSSAQLYLNPADIVDQIERQLTTSEYRLDSEAKSRLSILKGLFAALRPMSTLPGFTVRAGQEIAFRDRIEEILEDAYLAEASELRRFIGFNANKASLRRDLRRLLRAVIRIRPWAKGGLELAEHAAGLPSVAGEVFTALAEALSVRSAQSPILLDPAGRPKTLARWRLDSGRTAFLAFQHSLVQKDSTIHLTFQSVGNE